MGKYHDAADALQREANRAKALVAAADALAEIGSLEQVADEAGRAAQAAQDELAETKAALTVAQSNVKLAKAEAAQIVADASAKADGIIADANGEADHIKAQAIADATTAGEAAKAGAQQELAGIQAQIVTASVRLSDLNDVIATVMERHAVVIKAADDAESRLVDIKAQIAALATA